MRTMDNLVHLRTWLSWRGEGKLPNEHPLEHCVTQRAIIGRFRCFPGLGFVQRSVRLLNDFLLGHWFCKMKNGEKIRTSSSSPESLQILLQMLRINSQSPSVMRKKSSLDASRGWCKGTYSRVQPTSDSQTIGRATTAMRSFRNEETSEQSWRSPKRLSNEESTVKMKINGIIENKTQIQARKKWKIGKNWKKWKKMEKNEKKWKNGK